MNSLLIFLVALYTTIVVSLLWGRFRFFRVTASVKKRYMYLYDPAAALQIFLTYYFYFSDYSDLNNVNIVLAVIGYSISLGIFWWAIVTAKNLDFAFTARINALITNGPYALVRHPFYLSYSLAWITSTLLFNNPILWITLCYMMAYYYIAAKSEEEAILTSDYSNEYRLYSQTAGMFLPRITKWKS